jgi:hypothetical protein
MIPPSSGVKGPLPLKMKRTYTYETLATSPTTIWFNNPRKELSSIINYHENMELVTHTI